MIKLKQLLIFCFCLLVAKISSAQSAGTLDSTFGFFGKVITTVGGIDDRIFALAIQPDGKIVTGGVVNNGTKFNFAIARYLLNGSLDSSFGLNGVTVTNISNGDDKIWDIALQTDGKIIAAGQIYNGTDSEIAVARYNIDGTLDNTFGINGIMSTNISTGDDAAYAIKIDATGKVYLGGSTQTNFALIKYDALGNLDSSFSSNGILLSASYSGCATLAIDNNGKIVAAGSIFQNGLDADFLVARFDSNGMADSTFGINGYVATDIGADIETINSVIIQNDSKIVVGGGADFSGAGSNWEFVVARYNMDGTPDSTFGSNGRVISVLSNGSDVIYKIQLQNDGKIIVAGYKNDFADFALARYTTNGYIDTTFGNNGIVSTDLGLNYDVAFAMAMQPDYKIVAAGETRIGGVWNFGMARYYSGLNVGILEFKNEQSPLLIYPNPVLQYATISYTLTQNEKLTMSLNDLTGRTIKTFMQSENKTEGEHTEYLYFDENLKAGVYILNIDNGKTIRSIKIIKN